MLTIAIPQLYCGASGKRGAYNRQEVGLARAFAALGCRAVVLYPAPGGRRARDRMPGPRCQGAVPAGQSLAGQRFLPELAAAAG